MTVRSTTSVAQKLFVQKDPKSKRNIFRSSLNTASQNYNEFWDRTKHLFGRLILDSPLPSDQNRPSLVYVVNF